MTWIACPSPQSCNRCHKALGFGDRAWRGELTPAVWCEPCAGEMGLDGLPGVDDFEAMTGAGEAMPSEFDAAMRRLRDAALRKGPRDLSARITGERE